MKNRGSQSNPQNRYRRIQVVKLPAEMARLPNKLPTEYFHETAKSIVASNRSPDVPFDRSINAYRGCEHGCVYCFARPTHAYLDWSPGLDFETKIVCKTNAPELLEKVFNKPGYSPKVIALGTNTDPYQPAESRLRITRGLLKLFLRYRHPVSIVTKGAGLSRDLDLIQALAKHRLVSVMISMTTLDTWLKRIMEPRAASPAKRLQQIAALREAGVPVGVLVAPVIPKINDQEIEHLLQASAKAGAQTAGYVLLRLPMELKTLFQEWLERHFPDRAKAVLNKLRESHGGKLYDSRHFHRQRGNSQYAAMIAMRFQRQAAKLALNERRAFKLDTEAFRRPDNAPQQGSLFAVK